MRWSQITGREKPQAFPVDATKRPGSGEAGHLGVGIGTGLAWAW